MGRKNVPTVLAELHGNPRKTARPTDEPQGQGDLWAPPRDFDAEQREQWHYVVDHAPPGLLTGTDRGVLTIYVIACVEHAKAAQEVRRLGQVVKTKDGNAIQNPFVGVMNRQALIMLKAGSEMGFSPSARASLGSRQVEYWEPVGGGGRKKGGELAAYLEQKPDRLDS